MIHVALLYSLQTCHENRADSPAFPQIQSQRDQISCKQEIKIPRSSALDSEPDRNVASSLPPALSRRKLLSESSPSTSSSGSRPRARLRESRLTPVYRKRWFVGAVTFFMALPFFSLALFVLLGLGSDHGSPSSAYATTSEEVQVRQPFFLWMIFFILLVPGKGKEKESTVNVCLLA